GNIQFLRLRGNQHGVGREHDPRGEQYFTKVHCGLTGGFSTFVLFTQAVERQSLEFSEPRLSRSFTVSGCSSDFSRGPFAISATVSPWPSATSSAPCVPPSRPFARALTFAPLLTRYLITSLSPT